MNTINRALQKMYNSTMPKESLSQWLMTSHLQPTTEPADSIPNYGLDSQIILDYDGLYKRRPYQQTPLAAAKIDYPGPVRAHYSIDKPDGEVPYASSELKIAKTLGQKVSGYDEYYPVRDPVRSPFPAASSNVDYDYEKYYDFNSNVWTTRDIPDKTRYPIPVDSYAFSKRIVPYNPEYASQTAGASAWQNEGPRDIYDPVIDSSVLDSVSYGLKRNGFYRPPANDTEKQILVEKIKMQKQSREKFYTHPAFNFVTLEQANTGFSKETKPRKETSMKVSEVSLPTMTWQQIQAREMAQTRCATNAPTVKNVNFANPYYDARQ